MNQEKLENNIQYIRDMIEKTRNEASSTWKYFILWGSIIILAIGGMNLLVYLRRYQLIWVNWVAFSLLGSIIQVVLAIKDDRKKRVKTYAQNAIAHLGFSGGLGYLLVGIIFPLLKLYPLGVIPVLISVLTGIILFTIGGIIELAYFKWSGILWLLAAPLMILIHWHYRSLLFIPLIAQSYLLPGFILYRQNKKRSPDD